MDVHKWIFVTRRLNVTLWSYVVCETLPEVYILRGPVVPHVSTTFYGPSVQHVPQYPPMSFPVR